MSNPNVINNDNGNKTEGIARKGIATALAAIVTPFLFTACKADIATASAPSDAPNTPLPAASAPVTPGPENTNKQTIDDKYKDLPHCQVLIDEQKVEVPSDLRYAGPSSYDVDHDGLPDPTDLRTGKILCLTNHARR